MLFRLTMLVAVALGVVSASKTNATHNASNDSTIKSLREASTAIFLVLTIFQAFQTLFLAKEDMETVKRTHFPVASYFTLSTSLC